MSGIGPELPPHLLAKRKRQDDEKTKNETSGASGAKQEKSPDEPEKRRRVIGPAPPPAPLEERPEAPPQGQDGSDSEDDDGFGPALPTGPNESAADDQTKGHKAEPVSGFSTSAPPKPKRDEWMMIPPKQDDLAARLDPTRQRPRGFNTGKGARATHPSEDDSSAWRETTEQKQKRLADEMMGVGKPSAIGPSRASATHAKDEREAKAAAKIREYAEKVRGPSLIEQHKSQKGAAAEEDDPSKRAFDREKDMAAGKHVGQAQRQDMLKKASGGFSSKFSGGSYL